MSDTAQAPSVPPTVPTPRKVAVLGAGSWGTAFAKIAADAARTESKQNPSWETILWGRDESAMQAMAKTGVNDRYFPNVRLPENLAYTADPREALDGADVVVLALPAQVLREQLKSMAALVPTDAVLVSLAKGLERGTGLRMSEVIAEVFPGGKDRIAVVSGPNLAKEIIQNQPTASVVASPSEYAAGLVSRVCATSYFRPYTSADVVGVEIGGLVKNVIALCVGICEGRDYGDNSKASIMTRGLAETTRLAVALGGRPETLAGLAGMGDLVATCSSPLSRNHTAGKLLALGLSEEEVTARMTQTAEGIKSAPVVLELARRNGVEMPIAEAVSAVLASQVTVDQLQPMLLGRQLKAETPHGGPEGTSAPGH
ncbi:NAD(P)H-dependent glycerol-3-phosphate dehydrogenase [Kocuria sp. TGY1127_2]|uniref:NAD(P)H-dependent glycerol-3-phosphate dehydrogenase n=1 Tax=Kocuria sp. TGY1127_2 TaxID=2711328 RepID=UPI001FAC657A|nr:NAD(P)H-dependent glycerol-3-phosphate dehydrogenase [Kocuria sp. TGY1127_2]